MIRTGAFLVVVLVAHKPVQVAYRSLMVAHRCDLIAHIDPIRNENERLCQSEFLKNL
jgi:hypothetical protein